MYNKNLKKLLDFPKTFYYHLLLYLDLLKNLEIFAIHYRSVFREFIAYPSYFITNCVFIRLLLTIFFCEMISIFIFKSQDINPFILFFCGQKILIFGE